MGEVGYCQSGIGFPEREQGRKKGIPFYKVSDMTLIGNELIMVTSNNYVSEEQILKNRWKVINSIPAIIFAKVGAALLLDRKRLVLNSFLIDNNTMAYILNEQWDYYFCKTLFDTIYLPQLSQVGALPSFNGKDVENLNVIIPKSKEEQTTIGNFFKQLDETIALHRRNCIKFQNLKTAYLENIFSTKYIQIQNGNKNAWEQRKLGEIGILSAGGDVKKDRLTPNGKYPVIANALTNAGIIGFYDTYKIKAPALTITGRGDVGIAKARNVPFTPVVRLLVLEHYSIYDTNFLEQAINKISICVESTGVPQLTVPQCSQYQISCPSLKEQTAIGNFFKQLDDTIALHQKELAKYQQIKAACLEKMFVK